MTLRIQLGRSRRRAVVLTLVSGLLAAPAAAPGRALDRVACGDTITHDVRLGTNLVDCPGPGLVVGADGVTIDLNGHTVDGDAAGDDSGIDTNGHSGLTITHGAVREFTEGVLVDGGHDIAVRAVTSSANGHGGITVDSSRDVVIADDVLRDSLAGVIVGASELVTVTANRASGNADSGIVIFHSSRVRIAGNTVTTSGSSAGIGVYDGSADNEVIGNRLSRNSAGIGLDNGAARNLVAQNTLVDNDNGVIVDIGTHDNQIADNRVEGSEFEGIVLVGSYGNLVARNSVARNGADGDAGGIVVIANPDDPSQTSDANLLADNAATDNHGDGIHVGPGQSGNVVQRNRANRNSELGIFAAPGTIDGGGNLAARNGDPLQCVGITCG